MPPKGSGKWKAETPKPKPDPVSNPPADEPIGDAKPLPSARNADAPFVSEKELKAAEAVSNKAPTDKGFIAELVAGAGQKLHETEFELTGDRVFLHGPADERIWNAVGRYVESTLDPAKYGVVVLLVVLLGSEVAKIAIYGKHRADAKERDEKSSKKKRGKGGNKDGDDQMAWKA